MAGRVANRPEIDGLRALAIIPVLLFHLNLSIVPGGFVGVDVFFVISGYLITRLIVAELDETGEFRFKEFYLRRVRRLMPAFFSTLSVSFFLSFVLMSNTQFRQFCSSVIAAAFSFSNFYFWMKADYFDAQAATKPLLHTWSLAVEEQFYLVWPAVAVAAFKFLGRNSIKWLLCAILGSSLIIAHIWLLVDAQAAFYLLPARAFELGIGALLVFLPRHMAPRGILAELIAVLGIAMIVVSIVFYSERTPFPGIAALLPCLGAAFFIASENARFASSIFRFSPIVWIGRISYSLYLVHWPVIVFFLMYEYRPPGLLETVVLVCAIFMLAVLQFWFVEERFRYVKLEGHSSRIFIGAVAAWAVLLIIPSLAGEYYKAFDWRVPSDRLLRTASMWRQIERRSYCSKFSPEMDKAIFSCQNFRNKKKDLFIWGDSHARHLVAGFSEAFPDYNIYVLYQSGCPAQSGFGTYKKEFGNAQKQDCINRNVKAMDYFISRPGSNVIITGSKVGSPSSIAKSTNEMIGKLNAAGAKSVMLGDFIRTGTPLVDCMSVPSYLIDDKFISRRCVGLESVQREELEYNAKLKELVPDFVPVDDKQCSAGKCLSIYDGELLFYDDHHLNVPGSIYFVGLIKDRLPF